MFYDFIRCTLCHSVDFRNPQQFMEELLGQMQKKSNTRAVALMQRPRIHCMSRVRLCLKSVLLCFYSWHAIIVDGHSVEELCKVLSQPRHQPLAIIAKTIKGKGIPGTLTTCFLQFPNCTEHISNRCASIYDTCS